MSGVRVAWNVIDCPLCPICDPLAVVEDMPDPVEPEAAVGAPLDAPFIGVGGGCCWVAQATVTANTSKKLFMVPSLV
jgi:hypothetical protein